MNIIKLKQHFRPERILNANTITYLIDDECYKTVNNIMEWKNCRNRTCDVQNTNINYCNRSNYHIFFALKVFPSRETKYSQYKFIIRVEQFGIFSLNQIHIEEKIRILSVDLQRNLNNKIMVWTISYSSASLIAICLTYTWWKKCSLPYCEVPIPYTIRSITDPSHIRQKIIFLK